MKRKSLLRIIKYLLIGGVITLTILFMLYIAVLKGIFGPLPDTAELMSITNEEASLIFSSDKVMIGKVFAENRTAIREFPEHLKEALISTEDKRFFEHKGYDTRSYLRVFFKTILLGQESSGGGSTISQQLAKNLFGRPSHGFLSMPVNKMREAIVASRLEEVYSKEDILLLYLNSVPFGENTYGVEAAAFRYFNRTTAELRTEQSALLVGLLKANTAFNPRLHPEASMKRRNLVLRLMEKEGYLTEGEADSLQQLPLGLDYTNYEIDNPHGYFVYQVKKEAARILADLKKEDGTAYDLKKDGLKIITTLDHRLQKMALSAVGRQLSQKQPLLDQELERAGARKAWEKENSLGGTDDMTIYRSVFDWEESGWEMTRTDSLWHYHSMLHAAVLMMEPGSGKIRVWVGGNHFRYMPYDLVLAQRQAASSFKPLMYAAALEQGYDPCDWLENEWEENPDYPEWNPENYDRTSGGKVPLWFALSRSLNIPSVNLYLKLDREELQKQCALLGIDIPDEERPSLALGSEEVSLYEMVQAYSAFASYGDVPEPLLIETILDEKGDKIYEAPFAESHKALGFGTAAQINKMLINAVNEGTGMALRGAYGVRSEIAGKTGTSQDYSDAWFFAYTQEMVAGVWVGAMSPTVHFSTGANGSGSRLALPIAGMMIHDMESSNALRARYLTGFDPDLVDSAYFHCDTASGPPSGIRRFFDDLFGKDRKEEKKVDKEQVPEAEKKEELKEEGKVKSWFRKVFGKKKKKEEDR